jgi:formylglycine-generating enzyme
MAWYKTGTVTVANGSTTVTGSGTQWVSNARLGEAIVLPDGKIYEIVNIASDTSITIAPGYLGSNQSGNYFIAPTMSYIRDLASRASELIDEYQALNDGPAQGKFSDGDVAVAGIGFFQNQGLGFYRIAANRLGITVNGSKVAEIDSTGLKMESGKTITDPTLVKTAGDQTIGGVKTFSSNPISSAAQSTATNSLTRRDFVTGLDGANVKLTGNQTITGAKTFNGDLIVGSKLNDIGAAYLSRVSQERAVMAASGGNMRLIWDNSDKPSYMYRVPLGLNGDVGLPGGATVHPAFIVNGTTIREFWVGAFPASLDGGKAYSIPGVDPAASTNFDNSFNACTSKGAGWHMMSNAEWGYIQAWCMANGYQPRGNTNYGRAYDRVLETGTRPEAINPGVASGHGRTLTGSGPHTWRHNGMEFGIADLVGNVWEWCSGMRLVGGEIQIIPNNDAAAGVDNTASSTLWKAILADGSLVAPGTADALKLGSAAPFLRTTTNNGAISSFTWNNVAADVAVPDLLRQLALFPQEGGGHIGSLWFNASGERLPLRGGSRGNAANAGLSALNLYGARSGVHTIFGFRPAFVDL